MSKFITEGGKKQIINTVEDLKKFKFPKQSVINMQLFYLKQMELDTNIKELPMPVTTFTNKDEALQALFNVLPLLTPEVEEEINQRAEKDAKKSEAAPKKEEGAKKGAKKEEAPKPVEESTPKGEVTQDATGATPDFKKEEKDRREGERRQLEAQNSPSEPTPSPEPIEGAAVVHRWFPFEGRMATFCQAHIDIPMNTPQQFPVTCPACLAFEAKVKKDMAVKDRQDTGPKFIHVHNTGARAETFRSMVYAVIEKNGPISIEAAAKKLAKKLHEDFDTSFVTKVRNAFHKLDGDRKIKKHVEAKEA